MNKYSGMRNVYGDVLITVMVPRAIFVSTRLIDSEFKEASIVIP